ncbi:MAG: hypothetical protein AB7F43_03505 [Bacteriovoracia bacterium]
MRTLALVTQRSDEGFSQLPGVIEVELVEELLDDVVDVVALFCTLTRQPEIVRQESRQKKPINLHPERTIIKIVHYFD